MPNTEQGSHLDIAVVGMQTSHEYCGDQQKPQQKTPRWKKQQVPMLHSTYGDGRTFYVMPRGRASVGLLPVNRGTYDMAGRVQHRPRLIRLYSKVCTSTRLQIQINGGDCTQCPTMFPSTGALSIQDRMEEVSRRDDLKGNDETTEQAYRDKLCPR